MSSSTLESYSAEMALPKLIEIQKETRSLLRSIEKKCNKSREQKLKMYLQGFWEEARNRPLATSGKCLFAALALGAIYPAVVGSWACLKTFRIIPLDEMESADRDTAMAAAQGIGNTGMAITYMVQLHEFVFHPIHRMLQGPYEKIQCEEIRRIYREAMKKNQSTLLPHQIAFLIESENRQLSRLGGHVLSDGVEIDALQKQIDEAIQLRLKPANILAVLLKQIRKSTAASAAAKLAKGAFLTSLVAGSSVVLALGTYGCYKPFSLQSPLELESSDAQEVEDAVANYANAGHGLEYLAVMGILSCKMVQSLVGKQYHKAVRKETRKVYLPHIRNPVHTKEVSDLLYERMQQSLNRHRPH